MLCDVVCVVMSCYVHVCAHVLCEVTCTYTHVLCEVTCTYTHVLCEVTYTYTHVLCEVTCTYTQHMYIYMYIAHHYELLCICVMSCAFNVVNYIRDCSNNILGCYVHVFSCYNQLSMNMSCRVNIS